MLRFWIDTYGVDGFRIDAPEWFFEDPEFTNEPISGQTTDEDDYGYLQHIYTFNLVDDITNLVDQFNDVLGEFEIIDGENRLLKTAKIVLK